MLYFFWFVSRHHSSINRLNFWDWHCITLMFFFFTPSVVDLLLCSLCINQFQPSFSCQAAGLKVAAKQPQIISLVVVAVPFVIILPRVSWTGQFVILWYSDGLCCTDAGLNLRSIVTTRLDRREWKEHWKNSVEFSKIWAVKVFFLNNHLWVKSANL